jgi:hypothetical protein
VRDTRGRAGGTSPLVLLKGPLVVFPVTEWCGVVSERLGALRYCATRTGHDGVKMILPTVVSWCRFLWRQGPWREVSAEELREESFKMEDP